MLSSLSPLASQNQAQSVVSTATQSGAQVKAAPVPAKTAPQPVTTPSADTVSISTAAQAALKESIETPAQTAKEAGNGDRQAQRLLAKEVAANHMS